MSEADERAAVVAAALSWAGTPYRHRARLKGVGVDCATLIQAAYVEAGLVADRPLPAYSPQWHLNRDAQAYLKEILDNAPEIPGPPGPGDVAVWRIGRTFSHGAIVVAWPRIVHATIGRSCYEDDALRAAWLDQLPGGGERPRKFFSFWAR